MAVIKDYKQGVKIPKKKRVPAKRPRQSPTPSSVMNRMSQGGF